MKRITLGVLLAMVTVVVNGCVFKVPSTVSPATNVYSSYDDKILSKVVLVLDESLRNIQQPVDLKSITGSAHSYVVNLEDSLATSIQQATQAIFAEVIERPIVPPQNILKKMGCAGTVFVKLTGLYATLNFDGPFWKSHTTASCGLELSIKVRAPDGVVLVDRFVGATRAVDSRGGFSLTDHHLLSDLISQTIRETMGRYAEMIVNSEEIRNSFSRWHQ